MKRLILGRGRFANIRSKVNYTAKPKFGSGNAGHGGYVKKDFPMLVSGGGIKKKLQPLKFKM
jgi:hypothetical protein